MEVVKLPNVVESFHRAFNDVLAPFLSTGNSQFILGEQIQFYNCELHYHLERLNHNPGDNPLTKPFVVFAGTRSGRTEEFKCKDPTLSRPGLQHGNEVRQMIQRTVYVGVSRTLELELPPYSDPVNVRQANLSDPEQIWSQLWLVLSYCHKSFYDRGIYYPKLNPIPVPAPHPDYYMVSGQLELEVRYQFRRED